jgi:hypothetical protein
VPVKQLIFFNTGSHKNFEGRIMIRPELLLICLPNPYPDYYSHLKSKDPDLSIRGFGFVIQIYRPADPNPSENLRFRSANFGLVGGVV